VKKLFEAGYMEDDKGLDSLLDAIKKKLASEKTR